MLFGSQPQSFSTSYYTGYLTNGLISLRLEPFATVYCFFLWYFEDNSEIHLLKFRGQQNILDTAFDSGYSKNSNTDVLCFIRFCHLLVSSA